MGYRSAFLVLFCCLIAQSVAAQKLQDDPRPLRGLDGSAIKSYSSVEAFLTAHPPSGLLSQASAIGHATRTMRTLPPRQAASFGQRTGATTGKRTAIGRALEGVRIERAPNGTVRWMQGHLNRVDISAPAGKAARAEAYMQAAASTIQQYAATLRLDDPAKELRPVRTHADDLGYVHSRFEQTYQGVPVWGRDLYVHFDEDGTAYAINGTYEPTPRDVTTTPTISDAAAKEVVISELKSKGRWAPVPEATAQWLGIEGVESQLVLYPGPTGNMRLAYEVSLHPNLIEWYSYLVDAETSEVLSRIARHCSALPHDDSLPPPSVDGMHLPPLSTVGTRTGAADTRTAAAGTHTAAAGTGSFVDATGFGLDGAARNFRAYRHDDGSHHLIWDIPNLDTQAFQFPNFTLGGLVTLSADNTDANQDGQIRTIASADNTWTDPSGVSAHDNALLLYQYYKNTFDRNAIDDQDSPILSVIHVTSGGKPMDNAYWNGKFMAYGDGADISKPWAGAVDLTGHEMTHGVIEHTAGLVYQFQPGALNESLADVFAVLMDPEDFFLFEDVALPSFGPAFRDLLNPDNPQLSQPQPAHMRDFQNYGIDYDNGGVHINSGIPNRAAALLMQAIGHDKVQDIYYRAISTYLTRNSQFGDARNAVEQAAKDLFGEGGAEVAAVQQAFDAVGITTGTGTDGEGGNDLPPVTGGLSLITFLLEDGSIGVLDVTDPNNPLVGVFEDDAAKARVDLDLLDFSQLTAPRNGERIWFVNTQGQLALIDVQTGEVSVFTNLQIEQPGDLWNASVSPDESYVALVSAYANDPTLYIFTGDEIGAVPLTPESTQDGIQTQTIRYPDVVSWSPNPQIPRIAFDAFNEVELRSGLVSYWGIYEVDFSSGRIYNLMPAQPAGINVGNVAYSNTDPDIITFNAFDATDTWDVVLGNYAEGQILPLEIPSIQFEGGATITDAQRPSFSPDDGMLVFSSPANGILGFVDLAAQQLSYLELGASVYNPRWFTLGGSGGSQNQAPTAAFTISATSGEAPFNVELDASGSEDPNGDPLTYRWDFGDGTVGSGVTAAHTYSQSGTFTISLNVTDGGGLAGAATQDVDVSAGALAADPGDELPRTVALHQNHPNPFNPSTVIRFDLPAPVEAELTVYDMLGRPVRRLVSRPMSAGTHEVHFEAGDLPSGVYIARLQAGGTVLARKMLLLR